MQSFGKLGSAAFLALSMLNGPSQTAAAELPVPGLEDLKLPPLKRIIPALVPRKRQLDPALVEGYGKRQFTSGVNTGIFIGVGLGVGGMLLLNELRKGNKTVPPKK